LGVIGVLEIGLESRRGGESIGAGLRALDQFRLGYAVAVLAVELSGSKYPDLPRRVAHVDRWVEVSNRLL